MNTIKKDVFRRRLPPWMRRRVRNDEHVLALKKIIRRRKLNTVCQSAGCPNISECFRKPTATFMILGDVCTRNCRFCGVSKGIPIPVDPDEPRRIAEAVRDLELKHVVITSVTRDDLPDGGARQFARTVEQIHHVHPGATVETLIPDFMGDENSLETILETKVDILNHNIETVPRLYPEVRSGANFERSLKVLQRASVYSSDMVTKSGLMVGLGETYEEMVSVFRDLNSVGCDALTIGQYLSPNASSLPVAEYIVPEIFVMYKKEALDVGIKWINASPYVRSSFNADEMMRNIKEYRIE